MSYNFTVKIETPKYTIDIDVDQLYGYFEHNELGDEKAGGLWFERVSYENERGYVIDLVDYDGVFALPTQVATALRQHGYHVDEVFN